MYIYYLVDDINYHINWWADTDSKKTCSKASKEVSYNIVGESWNFLVCIKKLVSYWKSYSCQEKEKFATQITIHAPSNF
jgi:hypothetical protein